MKGRLRMVGGLSRPAVAAVRKVAKVVPSPKDLGRYVDALPWRDVIGDHPPGDDVKSALTLLCRPVISLSVGLPAFTKGW